MAILSKAKVAKMMLERLLELPDGSKRLKDNATLRLGMVGQLSTSREINAAWDEAKKKAAKLHPEKFVLDCRGVLHWNDGSLKQLDKTISSANFKKLNELSNIEECTVNSMVSKLIAFYKKNRRP
ncbi:MAG: hypothetical protein HKP58_06225 [Desulfatitalea sp.]|nr:hypothetical protein [Desulfatitalea sp.]NNJ99993.1 hypothetical protein [Desulfatitalea sp.]